MIIIYCHNLDLHDNNTSEEKSSKSVVEIFGSLMKTVEVMPQRKLLASSILPQLQIQPF